jgi:hypothetical protein
MVGNIELARFDGLTKLPQPAATAWSAMDGIMSAGYKPLIYLGEQVVKGVNYWFIAEQTLTTHPPIRRVVKLAINGFDGQYKLVSGSIEVIA